MHRRNVGLAISLLLLLGASAWAAEGNRLTIDLFLDWEWVSSPQISPGGREIVFTRRWTDKINDKFETDIWIMNADGSKKRFPVKGSQPTWSPDGRRLAYTGYDQNDNTYNVSKLYLMDAGGANKRLLSAELDREPNGLTYARRWNRQSSSTAPSRCAGLTR